MDYASFGRLTFNSRVEAWECDHNQHWNVRNYLRSFQSAGHVAADMSGAVPTAGVPTSLHTRFHRELFHSAVVSVRSAVLSDGPHSGAIVHLLISDGQLSATGLVHAGYSADALPRVSAKEVPLALPRGIDGGPHDADQPSVAADAWRVEHGMVQPFEVDHTGTLPEDHVMRRVTAATSELMHDLGFTPEFVKTHKISRMGVEIKITRFAPIPVGTRLTGTARIVAVKPKGATVRHQIFRPDGKVLAAVDQSMVTVDMTTRRATEIPDFLARAV